MPSEQTRCRYRTDHKNDRTPSPRTAESVVLCPRRCRLSRARFVPIFIGFGGKYIYTHIYNIILRYWYHSRLLGRRSGFAWELFKPAFNIQGPPVKLTGVLNFIHEISFNWDVYATVSSVLPRAPRRLDSAAHFWLICRLHLRFLYLRDMA